MMRKIFLLLLVAALLAACGPRVPENFKASNEQPDIYPDYREVTVPANQASEKTIVSSIIASLCSVDG